MNYKFTVTIMLACVCGGELIAQSKTQSPFQKHIAFLASDSLQGRLAGSPGEKISATYIHEQFQQAGLKPWNDTIYQNFDIVKLRIPTSKTIFKMFLGSENSDFAQSFVLFEDFFPLSESSNNDSAEGEILYCGYGIAAESMGWNDYKNLENTKGKIFAMMLGFPDDEAAPQGPLAAYAGISMKVQTALKYGAAGVIFVPGSRAAAEPKGDLDKNLTPSQIPVIYFKKPIRPELRMSAKLRMAIAAPSTPAYNVMGYRNNHKKNTVIICAHHDHLGHNEYGNSMLKNNTEIHNGADDNASGVAAMIELANDLKGRKFKKNNYLFLAFSGEELGLLGSKYFVEHSPVPLEKINYVINIDMLGRLDSSKRNLVIHGTGTSPRWSQSIAAVQTDTSRITIITSESGLGPSDHASFYLKNIPVLHFFTGQHKDYHKPSDDELRINYSGMESAYDIILQVIRNTNKAGKLEFTKTKDAQTGRSSFKVTLGIMPDYAFAGSGLKIDAVTDGKPAAKAGIQPGDIVTRLGTFDIANVQEYTKALGTFNKGDKASVSVLRGSEVLTFEVEF